MISLATIKEKITKNHSQLLVVLLWLLLWAGYNTTIGRILDPGFPHGALDLVHGIRALFPLVAGWVALVYLYKNRRNLPESFFLTPAGLLLLYSLAGVVASAFSTNFIEALYWALMYGSVILVVVAISQRPGALENIRFFINLNWFIAGSLAFGLLLFFLIQPGVFQSLTIGFMFCVQRPYEGLANIPVELQTFGMAGTRPTGLGRYAGIIALIAFWRFLHSTKKVKLFWLVSFIFFLGVLMFSKGKTEIVAFIAAIVGVFFLAKKFKSPLLILLTGIIALSFVIIFYNIPCENIAGYLPPPVKTFIKQEILNQPLAPTVSQPTITSILQVPAIQEVPIIEQTSPVQASPVYDNKTLKSVFTLSGRVNGVWLDSFNLFLTGPLTGFGFQADRFFLQGQHAHNTLLHALIQTGLLGTIPFVIAFIIMLTMLWRLLKSTGVTQSQKIFLVEVTGALIFFLVRGLTESLAFYSADWLFIAPLILYIQVLYFHNFAKN